MEEVGAFYSSAEVLGEVFPCDDRWLARGACAGAFPQSFSIIHLSLFPRVEEKYVVPPCATRLFWLNDALGLFRHIRLKKYYRERLGQNFEKVTHN